MAWPNSQTREVKLTVQNAQVAGSGTHSAFPVLITRANLPDEMCSPTDSNRAQSDGGDIRAGTASDMGTQLPMEIVRFEYDSSDGAGDAVIEIWVLRDLATATDTDIWLGYNTAGTTSKESDGGTYGRNAVWADYAAVYHGDDLVDSTGNGNTLTANGAAAAGDTGGKIGDALGGLNASTANHFVATSPSGITDDPATLQAWFKPDSDLNTGQGIVSLQKGVADPALIRLTAQDNISGNPVRVQSRDGSLNNNVADTSTGVSFAAWNLAHAVVDADGGATAYLNAGGAVTVASTTLALSGWSYIRIGVWDSSGGGAGLLQPFGGLIDEVRIRPSTVSADWISTEYANQNSPATFIIESAPQAVGGGAPPEGSGSVTSTGAIAGEGYATASGAGPVSGTGAIAGTGEAPTTTAEGAGSVAGAGTLAADGEAVHYGSGAIAGAGSIAGEGYTLPSGAGSVSATGTLAGRGQSEDEQQNTAYQWLRDFRAGIAEDDEECVQIATMMLEVAHAAR